LLKTIQGNAISGNAQRPAVSAGVAVSGQGGKARRRPVRPDS
jgi:hypothetical protein